MGLFKRPLPQSTVNLDKEIWRVALWVENRHGSDGSRYIASQIARLAGDPDGQALWRKVGARLAILKTRPGPIYGKPETWPQ